MGVFVGEGLIYHLTSSGLKCVVMQMFGVRGGWELFEGCRVVVNGIIQY